MLVRLCLFSCRTGGLVNSDMMPCTQGRQVVHKNKCLSVFFGRADEVPRHKACEWFVFFTM